MNHYDLIVIGSGPAGEVGAIRAAQLGLRVALIEKREHLGGTCLNVGCIPTKSLLESAKTWTKLTHMEELGFSLEKPSYSWAKIMARKDKIVDAQRKGLLYLMKKNKIDVFFGAGQFLDSHRVQVGQDTLHGKHILIATGSRVRELPFMKEDGKKVFTSDSILFIDRVPKSLAILGGGVIGMEFASLFGQFGTKITVIEMAGQLLSQEDPECVKELTRYLDKTISIDIKTGVKLQRAQETKDGFELFLENNPQGIHVDAVLLSIGRAPVTEGLGLEACGLGTTAGGFIPVDSHYQTKVPHIFAVGDVIQTPALAHTASAEAIHAVEILAGHGSPLIDYDTNPSAIYTYPEIASLGKSEAFLKDNKIPYRVSKFPFAPMAKAKIEEATQGFIKILVGEPHGEILGVHMVGAKATELIGEFALGKVLETTIHEIGYTIHPHPTLSETIMEAAHGAMGGAIHL